MLSISFRHLYLFPQFLCREEPENTAVINRSSYLVPTYVECEYKYMQSYAITYRGHHSHFDVIIA